MHVDQLPGSFFGPANLVDLLRHRSLHQALDRAFIYLHDGENISRSVTYEDVDRQARTIATALQQRGLAGQRALLLYPAGLDFIAAFFGCMYAGVVAVTAYPPRRNRNMNRIVAIADDADAKIALTTLETQERVQTFLGETPDLMKLEWLATDQLPLDGADRWQSPDVHGDTLALLQYTSGSTGIPKGVMLTHSNLMHNSAMICYAFEHTRSGGGVFWLPSYHDMGLIGGILQPMYCGRPNVIFSPANFLQRPVRWLKAISHFRATISGGPNFAYDLAVEKVTDEDMETLDLSSWTLAFNGAEPVRADTIDRFSAKFARCGFRREAFYPCYGLAEATLIVSGGLKSALPIVRSFAADALENHEVVETLPDDHGARSLVGSGGNLLDQQIVIVDPKTFIPCPANQVGEIWVSGPSVAVGYWNRADATAETFQAYLKDSGAGPFLRTGDLGFMVDGELFVTGRLKDLIIVRGVNYYPQDIERTVEQCHEQLRTNAGAAFTTGEPGAERLVLVLEVQRRQELNFDELVETIRRKVASEHELRVDAIMFVKAGSIPKTSSGKIQRHACRNGFLENTLEVIGRWSATEGIKASPKAKRRERESAQVDPAVLKVAETVYEQVRRVAKERSGELTLETNIVELGLDSLERMEIAASIEEVYGGRFPEDVLADIETCGQVAEAVVKYLGTEPREQASRLKTDDIPTEYYRFADMPEYRMLRKQIDLVASTGLKNPYFTAHQGITNATTFIEGKEYISFTSYNYVGMSGDPEVAAASKAAIDKFGTSTSASRLVSGEKTLHVELEKALCRWLNVEAVNTFVSGHGTNETTIGHLFGPGDLILHDELAHNSIIQGSILSGARRRPFRHNDWAQCDELLGQLRSEYRRVLVAIEGVYSMDGDYCDLPKFIEVKKRHKAFLYVDEAHSIATMGPTGRGMGEFAQVDPKDVDLWMGTLSKGLGGTGGYVGGCREVVEYLKYTAPAFVFSGGIAPAQVGSALAALRVLEREPQRVKKLHENASLFLSLAKHHGLNTGHSGGTPVVPIIIGNSRHCLMLSQQLFARGINVQPILHPAVEEQATRLRFFITSCHSTEQIRSTVDAIAEELRKIDPSQLQPGRNSANGTATNGSSANRQEAASISGAK